MLTLIILNLIGLHIEFPASHTQSPTTSMNWNLSMDTAEMGSDMSSDIDMVRMGRLDGVEQDIRLTQLN